MMLMKGSRMPSCLRRRTVAAVLVLAVLLPVVLVQSAAVATPLVPYPDPVIEATDMVVAGLGDLHDAGGGTIALSGIGEGSVSPALLYWSGPTNSSDPTANASISFAGSDITGSNIGVASSNCFGDLDFSSSLAYRADVTTLVTGDGNDAIANTTNAVARADGASLIVFFDDGNTTNRDARPSPAVLRSRQPIWGLHGDPDLCRPDGPLH